MAVTFYSDPIPLVSGTGTILVKGQYPNGNTVIVQNVGIEGDPSIVVSGDAFAVVDGYGVVIPVNTNYTFRVEPGVELWAAVPGAAEVHPALLCITDWVQ